MRERVRNARIYQQPLIEVVRIVPARAGGDVLPPPAGLHAGGRIEVAEVARLMTNPSFAAPSSPHAIWCATYNTSF